MQQIIISDMKQYAFLVTFTFNQVIPSESTTKRLDYWSGSVWIKLYTLKTSIAAIAVFALSRRLSKWKKEFRHRGSHSKPESQQLRQAKTSNIVENQFKHKTLTKHLWQRES